MTIEATRVYATEGWLSPNQTREIQVQIGMHKLQKVASIRVDEGCQIVTPDELATVLCEYIDTKLARGNKS